MATGIRNPTSFVERGNQRFLLIDCPTEQNLDAYIQEMKQYNVTVLVRACECKDAYPVNRVNAAGITTFDLPFVDGDSPPSDIIQKWLEIVAETFRKNNPTKTTIAVHCIAGLGRTPLLVAIALIQDNMQALDAVSFIRSKRRGAINAKQLKFLQTYKPVKGGGCIII
jgi:protein tyrosine phosphatase type 4A